MFISSIVNQKIDNEDTGNQFYKTSLQDENNDDQSFSYEIQMQKQYVQRLKMQRERIESLYTKYDEILLEMKRKDNIIKEKDDKIKIFDQKLKGLQLNYQQMSLIQQETKQIRNQNYSLKNSIIKLQNQNSELIQKIKLKQHLNIDEKQQLQQINSELQQKLSKINHKILTLQNENQMALKSQKDKYQKLKKQHQLNLNNFQTEIHSLRQQLINKDDSIHMLTIQYQFLQQKLAQQEQSYTGYLKDLQSKIQKSQRDKKHQIKSLKDIIEQKNLEISTLEVKVKTLSQQLQTRQYEISQAQKLITQEKRLFDQDLFQIKSQMNAEKNHYKEQLMYCQNHITKLEAKLDESLKREKNLLSKLKKFQTNQIAKKNLREIERQQIQKINRILNFQ